MDAWTARDNYAFAILIAGERDSRTCPKRQHGKGDNTPSGEADLILGLPDRPPSAPLILLPSTLSLGEYLPFYNLETIPIHPRISIYPSIYSQLVLLSPLCRRIQARRTRLSPSPQPYPNTHTFRGPRSQRRELFPCAQ